MPTGPEHFERLTTLLALERREEVERLSGLRGTLALGELEARGLVVLDMVLVDEAVGLGGRFLVSLAKQSGRPLGARLSDGDLVEVRPRRSHDASPVGALVARCSRDGLQLAFERAPPAFVREGRLRVDVVTNDVTYERAKVALEKAAALAGKQERTRQVLLGTQSPAFDAPAALFPTAPLNPEQRAAAEQALAAKDFFLVHGPPGTGKSHVLAEVAVAAVARGERVVCTAASNAAVDHLLELCLDRGLSALRLGHPARVQPRLHEHTLDVRVEEHPDRQLARELFDEAFELLGYARRQRSQGRSRTRFSQARSSAAEARALMDEARELEKKALRSVLDHARVVCATLSGLPSPVLAGRRFGLALLDEATQAIEPLALWAFLLADRVVLAGDPHQLPPTVLSVRAAQQGLSTSLFERLLAEHGEGTRRLLREQYRMHEALMEFPSRQVYDGQLRAHPQVARRTLADAGVSGVEAPPLLFVDTAGKGWEESAAALDESLCNEGEAGVVVARARELLQAGLAPAELAVIAPYRAQAALLRERLSHPGVEVDTVDAFQGREKDAVLLSLTRSNARGEVGFLSDLRRMNVALTRARRHLFVVGDSGTLGCHPFYAAFVEHAQAAGAYRSVWEWPYER